MAAIKPKPPYRLWGWPTYTREVPDLYTSINFNASGGGAASAKFWNRRGVVLARWAYGPQSSHSNGKWEYYMDQCNPISKEWTFTSIAMDEWVSSGAKDFELCTRGLRAAREKWPDVFIVVWGGLDKTFVELLQDGTIDLGVIEGYTLVPYEPKLRDDSRVRITMDDCEMAREGDVEDKIIVAFGHVNEGLPPAHLNRFVGLLHDRFPKMPGIGFIGPWEHSNRESNKALAIYAEYLSNFYYGDEVLFIDGFESGNFEEGNWQGEGPATIPASFTWLFNDPAKKWTGGQWSGGYFDTSVDGAEVRTQLSEPGEVELDLTNIVRAWLVEGKPNRGLLVQLGSSQRGLYGSRWQCDAAFISCRNESRDKRPELEIQIKTANGTRKVSKMPVVDGTVSVKNGSSFGERRLKTYWVHGRDVGAIYFSFDLENLGRAPEISEATLRLHCESVNNSNKMELRAVRIHEDNVNTEPIVRGCDIEKAAKLLSGASISRLVSTRGRQDIRIQYLFKTFDMQAGDSLQIEWHDGRQWQTLHEVNRNTGFIGRTDVLPASAANNVQLTIRFKVTGSQTAGAYVDRVRVTGSKSSN